MGKYGQYCPVARALEIVGDRWSLLVIRDMLLGTKNFNDLECGLPGISRGLLSKRLKQLQSAGIIEKHFYPSNKKSTEYHLTESGLALEEILEALLVWGSKWAFGDPIPEELNSVLLMWWLQKSVKPHLLPRERVVVQFEFHGAEKANYWLVMSKQDVTLCLTDPGFDLNLLVTADLAAFFKMWFGKLSFQEALHSDQVRVEGIPQLARAFPDWFAWSAAAPVVRSVSESL
jgi:DNA-binding HxlR family transcriptional regulator